MGRCNTRKGRREGGREGRRVENEYLYENKREEKVFDGEMGKRREGREGGREGRRARWTYLLVEVKEGGADVLPLGLRPVEKSLEVAGAKLGRAGRDGQREK